MCTVKFVKPYDTDSVQKQYYYPELQKVKIRTITILR